MPDTAARLVAHRGEIIDLHFPEGALPEPMSLVEVSREGPPLRAEVAGPLTGDRARALVLDEPWGLRAGAAVTPIGPLKTLRGEHALGQLIDPTGRTLLAQSDARPPELEVHALRPPLAPSRDLLRTDWAGVELLCPWARGGSVGVLDTDGHGLPALVGLAGRRGWTLVIAAVGLSAADLLALRDLAQTHLGEAHVLLAAPATAPAAARARAPLAAQAVAQDLTEGGREVALLLADARMAQEANEQAQDLLGRRLPWTSGLGLQSGVSAAGALTVIELQATRPRHAPRRLLSTDSELALGAEGLDLARCRGSRAWPKTRGLRRKVQLALQGLEEGWLRAEDRPQAQALAQALRRSPSAPEPWEDSAARWVEVLDAMRL